MEFFGQCRSSFQINFPLYLLLRLEVFPLNRTQMVHKLPRRRETALIEVNQHVPEPLPQPVLDSTVLQYPVVVLGLRTIDPVDDRGFRNPKHLPVGFQAVHIACRLQIPCEVECVQDAHLADVIAKHCERRAVISDAVVHHQDRASVKKCLEFRQWVHLLAILNCDCVVHIGEEELATVGALSSEVVKLGIAALLFQVVEKASGFDIRRVKVRKVDALMEYRLTHCEAP